MIRCADMNRSRSWLPNAERPMCQVEHEKSNLIQVIEAAPNLSALSVYLGGTVFCERTGSWQRIRPAWRRVSRRRGGWALAAVHGQASQRARERESLWTQGGGNGAGSSVNSLFHAGGGELWRIHGLHCWVDGWNYSLLLRPEDQVSSSDRLSPAEIKAVSMGIRLGTTALAPSGANARTRSLTHTQT